MDRKFNLIARVDFTLNNINHTWSVTHDAKVSKTFLLLHKDTTDGQ